MNKKFNYYVVYCENEFSFISFVPLTDIYNDCNVYGVKYSGYCNILTIIKWQKNENGFIQWLHDNNVEYECKYYGM